MIPRPTPERFRLRRTMMFLSAQKPGLIKDAYIYGADSLILDLEDAVAENQKDADRFSLYHTLTTVDYGDTEVLVRINGLDTPHWREDVRVAVAAGADGIRIAKCESAADIRQVEHAVEQAEAEFGMEPGRTLLMAALESPKGVLNSYEICCASNRMLGIALSGGDFRKCMQVSPTRDGIEMAAARGHMVLTARAAGVQCFDTVFTDLDDMEGFRREVADNHRMGFDGKSVINPRQIEPLHKAFMPSEKDLRKARATVEAIEDAKARGSGVASLNGKMIDRPVEIRARRLLNLAEHASEFKVEEV